MESKGLIIDTHRSAIIAHFHEKIINVATERILILMIQSKSDVCLLLTKLIFIFIILSVGNKKAPHRDDFRHLPSFRTITLSDARWRAYF